jgi:hypothetical protein
MFTIKKRLRKLFLILLAVAVFGTATSVSPVYGSEQKVISIPTIELINTDAKSYQGSDDVYYLGHTPVIKLIVHIPSTSGEVPIGNLGVNVFRVSEGALVPLGQKVVAFGDSWGDVNPYRLQHISDIELSAADSIGEYKFTITYIGDDYSYTFEGAPYVKDNFYIKDASDQTVPGTPIFDEWGEPITDTTKPEVKPSPPPTVKKIAKKGVVKIAKKKTAKVFKKANKKSKVLAKLKKNFKFTILGKNGKYYKVTFKKKGKKITGYIAKKYVRIKK